NVDYLHNMSKVRGASRIYWGGSEIEGVLASCLKAIPEILRNKSTKLKNMRIEEDYSLGRRSNLQKCNVAAFAACLNYHFFSDQGDLGDTGVRCNKCAGRVFYGMVDIGGPDYFEHYYAWCAGCYQSFFMYTHQDDVNYIPLEFVLDRFAWVETA